MTQLKTLELHDNPLKNPPSDVCVGGVMQPIDRFIRTATHREGRFVAPGLGLLIISRQGNKNKYKNLFLKKVPL